LKRRSACQRECAVADIARGPALRIVALDGHLPLRALVKTIARLGFAFQGCDPGVTNGAHAQTITLRAQPETRRIVVGIMLMFTIACRFQLKIANLHRARQRSKDRWIIDTKFQFDFERVGAVWFHRYP
jgi:hypothetical protein